MSHNLLTWAYVHASRRLAGWHRGFVRFRRGSITTLSAIGVVLFFLAVLTAFCCLISLVIYTGFDHTMREYNLLQRIMRATQIVFLLQIVFSEFFQSNHSLKLRNRVLHWLIELLVVATFIPILYSRPVHPWFAVLADVLYSNVFLYLSLTIYSVSIISLGIIRIINQRTNPSLMLSISFLVIILLGSLLLSLPKCNVTPISYVDALFVSTSAVCITGLTPVDVSSQFTPLGILVLGFLIQTGALGVMTFTYFFALFFSGSSTIFSQLMLKDIIYTRSINALIPTLLYILSFTLVIEGIGAVAIWFSVHDTLGISEREYLIFAAFHSISSFCNAGFSTLPGGMSNPALMAGNISVYWITTLLIIAGAIGFPILVNLRDALFTWFKNHFTRQNMKPVHIYNMNTKIVICFFFWLFIIGMFLILVLENDNTLRGMTWIEKITQAAFNSAVPRSAGFSSVNPADFMNVTIIVVMFLMWVGGASQSTAGGIKVNTLAAIIYNLKAIVTGAPKVTAFHRNIALGSIRRANAVVALSIFAYAGFSILLLWFEPHLSARNLLFESLSALFTVGSSLGVTGALSDKSLILLCVAMFLGRVGIISLLTGILPVSTKGAVTYPEGEIIIS